MADSIQEVCDLLVAAWHQHGGQLASGQVERVLATRHLTLAARVDVYVRLAHLGIVCDEAAPQAGETPTEAGLEGERWPREATRRLWPDEEMVLGRHIAVAQRACAQVASQRIPVTPAVQALLERGAQAREHMIAANLPLVVTIAHPFRHRAALDWADLVQEGTIGLLRAVEKFDYTQGWRFATYAAWWIRQSLRRAVTDTGTPLRLPPHTAYDVHRFKHASRRLARQAPNHAPPLGELAAALEWTLEKTRRIAALTHATMLSLEACVGADQRQPLRDVLAAPAPGPEAVALHADTLARVAAALHHLPARHQDIVRLRFGFATGEAWTLAQIGAKWGLSTERIRQLQDQALALLRQHLVAPPRAEREERAPGARTKRGRAVHTTAQDAGAEP